MLQLTRRRARPLLAVTAAIVPLELRAFGEALGWGLTFPFALVVYVNTRLGGVRTQLRAPWTELGLLSQYDPGGRIGVVGWVVAGTVIVATAAFVLAMEWDGAWTPRRLVAVGASFAAAGALFVVTRVPMYETVFVSGADMPNWFTVPLGGIYVVVVGAVFVTWGRGQDSLTTEESDGAVG